MSVPQPPSDSNSGDESGGQPPLPPPPPMPAQPPVPPPPPAGGNPIPPPPPPPPAAQPAQPYGQPQPGYPMQSAAPQSNQNATIAFILSLLGVIVCPFFVLSIIGLVMAGKAKKEIDASGGWQTGSGFVTAARILGWIGVVYSVLVVVYIIFVFFIVGLAATNPDLFTTPTPKPPYTPFG